jgi:FkbM family methyltransferase
MKHYRNKIGKFMDYKNYFQSATLLLCLIPSLTYCDNSYQRFSSDNPSEVLIIAAPFLPKNPIILEAGAYDGNDSVKMAQFWPTATLHSFEPLPKVYERLVIKTHDFKQISTYQLALGDKVGTAPFYVSHASNEPDGLWQSSSLLAPKEHLRLAWWVGFDTQPIYVRTTTIDQWAQDNHVDHIDFMWLDMQGYELQALKAGPNILKNVKAILTEIEFVEAYASQPQYKEIKNWLESQGFTMIAINVDPEHLNGQWFGDALFVRK